MGQSIGNKDCFYTNFLNIQIFMNTNIFQHFFKSYIIIWPTSCESIFDIIIFFETVKFNQWTSHNIQQTILKVKKTVYISSNNNSLENLNNVTCKIKKEYLKVSKIHLISNIIIILRHPRTSVLTPKTIEAIEWLHSVQTSPK